MKREKRNFKEAKPQPAASHHCLSTRHVFGHDSPHFPPTLTLSVPNPNKRLYINPLSSPSSSLISIFKKQTSSLFYSQSSSQFLSQLSLPLLWRIFSRNKQRFKNLVPKKIYSPLAAAFSVLLYSIPMARSFSNVKVLSALVSDGFSSALSSRGYAAAAASQGVASSAVKGGSVAAARNSTLLKKSGEEKVVGSSEKVSWVPDPVTGYYRPENRSDEIDVAELRSILLKNKN